MVRCQRQERRRRGATVPEFALVCPLFFILLMAAFELSTLSIIRSTADNAAYEAARRLVVPGAEAADGIEEARRIMAVVGVRHLAVTVSPSVLDETAINVSVDVSVPFDDNAFLIPWFAKGVVVHARSELKTERHGGVTTQ